MVRIDGHTIDAFFTFVTPHWADRSKSLASGEGEKLVNVTECIEVPGFGIIGERVGNGVRQLMRAGDFRCGGVKLINHAIARPEIDPPFQ